MTLAQTVDSTGNLVVPTTTSSGSTWTGAVYQSELTCWQGGDPGYCGPNPIIRPGGNINYSHGATDIYQQVSIAQALPYSGTGLLVRGYAFNYTAKVGNGWDDGRYDYLQSYVKFYDAAGNIKLQDSYTHSSTHDWTNFGLGRSFTDRYTTQDLSTVRYGFVGQDYNYWAGPYGPEIMNVSFSLQYMRDPCLNSQLSSPQCPKFMETLSQMSALSPTVSAASQITTTATSPETLTVINIVADPTMTTVGVTTTMTASVTPTVEMTRTANPAGQSSISFALDSSRSQRENAESFALSLVRNNQQRETRIANQASSSAINEAAAAAQTAQREAELVAETAQLASILSAGDSGLQATQQQSTTATTTATASAIPAFTINLPVVQPGVRNESAPGSSVSQTNVSSMSSTINQVNQQVSIDSVVAETVFTNDTLSTRPQIPSNTGTDSAETPNTTGTQNTQIFAAIGNKITVETAEVETTISSPTLQPPQITTSSVATEPTEIALVTSFSSPVPQSISTESVVVDTGSQTNDIVTASSTPARTVIIQESTAISDSPVAAISVPVPRVDANLVSAAVVVEPNLPNTGSISVAPVQPVIRENENIQVQVEVVASPVVAISLPAADTNQATLPSPAPPVPVLPAQSQSAVIASPSIYVPPQTVEVNIVNPAQVIEIPVPTIQVAAPVSQAAETVAVENTSSSATNFTTNRTNPITAIIEQRPDLTASAAPVFAGPAVNTRAQDNELAGGVSIDSIARVPAGFDVYASLTLRDAAFYAPREIYRGQRNVDNRRALSSLAQEGRHQEMVDQQYRR